MNEEGYILFYDSGIGGLTTLKETLELLPNEKYIFFADDINCPYGNRSEEEIFSFVKKSLEGLFERFQIKMVVFACNTITTCCIDKIRRSFGVPIVGTEPAVLPAIRFSKSKEILVLATKLTLRQEKFERLKKSAGAKVFAFCFENLAKDIESALVEGKKIDIENYTKKIIEITKNTNIDALVLGCTHYSFLKETLTKTTHFEVFDGNRGVGKRVLSLLEKQGLMRKVEKEGEIRIILSSQSAEKCQRYGELLKSL